MIKDDLLEAEKKFRGRTLFATKRKRFARRVGIFLLLSFLVGCGVIVMTVDTLPTPLDIWSDK